LEQILRLAAERRRQRDALAQEGPGLVTRDPEKDSDRALFAEERLWELVAAFRTWVDTVRWAEESGLCAASDAYKTELQDAWRRPVGAWSAGDPWADAIIAWHDRNDIEPLAAFVQAGPKLSPAQWLDLAELLRTIDAKARPRRPGKPRGTSQQWRDPDYLAAWIAEQRIPAWEEKHGRKNVPDEEREAIIKEVVAWVKTWAITSDWRQKKPTRRKKPTVNRVRDLLNGSKSRRLP
jgi:hypothetical protein